MNLGLTGVLDRGVLALLWAAVYASTLEMELYFICALPKKLGFNQIHLGVCFQE